MTKIIEFDQKCESCKGTGLYVGIAERDGAGVVCRYCKGKGEVHMRIEYTPADGTRKRRRDVKRVYQVNPGIVIGTAKGKYELTDFGGMPYDQWEKGQPFPILSENRKFTCPAWWYQSTDYSKKPKWNECAGAGSFSHCQHFCHKDDCWARWDSEFAAQKVSA